MSAQLVVVGSANLDLIATAQRLPSPGETVTGSGYFEAPGGKGVNQAVAAARAGARVAFVGAVGDDHAGDVLRDVLAAEGIDIGGLATVSAPTGRALIGVSDDGENSIIVVPGANAHVTADHVARHRETIAAARVVLCQLEIPLESVIASFAMAAEGAHRILNPAPAASLPDELSLLLTMVIPNEHEVALLGGEDALRAQGVDHVVVTEGARGARHVHAAGVSRVEPHPVSPVDTVGAGDAFCGTVAARLSLGDDVARALRAGAVAGALATTARGAVPSLPRWDDVAAVLSAGS